MSAARGEEAARWLRRAVDHYRREVNYARTLRREARVSRLLLALTVAVHLGVVALGRALAWRWGLEGDGLGVALAFGAKINGLVWSGGEVWRLASAVFLHGGLLHVAFNGYALYVMGPLVEKLYGSRRLVVLYMVSGLASEVASALWTPGMSVGASGAIFGLLGALVVFGWKFRAWLPRGVARRLSYGMLPWVVVNLAIGFIPGLPFDNAAHLGGLAAGMIAALGLSTPLVGEGGRLQRWGLEVLTALAWIAVAWGLVFMALQVVRCGGGVARFEACHPLDR